MLIMVNVIVTFMVWLSVLGLIDSSFAQDVKVRFAMSPYSIVHGEQLYTLFTSMFLHFDWVHLLGNMLYLYVFGDNVEDALGHVSYLVFYTICGLAASLTYMMSLQSFDPSGLVVGASGAISGVLGAYVVLYPKAKILTLIFPIIVPIPALIFLGFWFFMQWFYVFFQVGGNIAWWAHIGGFIVGLTFALMFGLERKRAREARFRL